MNWRKWNRWLHRKLGFLFFGMAIIYGISGIALNHHITRHWTPSHIEKTIDLDGIKPTSRETVDEDYVREILEISGETSNYKQYFFPSEQSLMIYLKRGHITVDLDSGDAQLTKIRNRKVFRELNFLHYNKPKQLWTYVSDLFAFSLVLMAISGIIMVRGKRGIRSKNGWLFAAGVMVPLLFLIFYLWT